MTEVAGSVDTALVAWLCQQGPVRRDLDPALRRGPGDDLRDLAAARPALTRLTGVLRRSLPQREDAR